MATQYGQTAGPPPTSAGLAGKLAGIPAGKRTKWFILVAWIVVVAAVSPLAAKLGDVEKNDAAAWLPGNAESLAIANLQKQFSNGETSPAVVVYHRDGGLTDADRAKIEADRQALAQRFPQTPPGPVVPSQDGQAVLYAIPFIDTGSNIDNNDLSKDVKAVRDLIGDGGDGLQVKVTG